MEWIVVFFLIVVIAGIMMAVFPMEPAMKKLAIGIIYIMGAVLLICFIFSLLGWHFPRIH